MRKELPFGALKRVWQMTDALARNQRNIKAHHSRLMLGMLAQQAARGFNDTSSFGLCQQFFAQRESARSESRIFSDFQSPKRGKARKATAKRRGLDRGLGGWYAEKGDGEPVAPGYSRVSVAGAQSPSAQSTVKVGGVGQDSCRSRSCS